MSGGLARQGEREKKEERTEQQTRGFNLIPSRRGAGREQTYRIRSYNLDPGVVGGGTRPAGGHGLTKRRCTSVSNTAQSHNTAGKTTTTGTDLEIPMLSETSRTEKEPQDCARLWGRNPKATKDQDKQAKKQKLVDTDV